MGMITGTKTSQVFSSLDKGVDGRPLLEICAKLPTGQARLALSYRERRRLRAARDSPELSDDALCLQWSASAPLALALSESAVSASALSAWHCIPSCEQLSQALIQACT